MKVFLETPTEDIMDHLRTFCKYLSGELSEEELEHFLKEKEFLVLLVLVVFYFPQVMVLISGLAVTIIVLLGSYLIGAIFIDAFFDT